MIDQSHWLVDGKRTNFYCTWPYLNGKKKYWLHSSLTKKLIQNIWHWINGLHSYSSYFERKKENTVNYTIRHFPWNSCMEGSGKFNKTVHFLGKTQMKYLSDELWVIIQCLRKIKERISLITCEENSCFEIKDQFGLKEMRNILWLYDVLRYFYMKKKSVTDSHVGIIVKKKKKWSIKLMGEPYFVRPDSHRTLTLMLTLKLPPTFKYCLMHFY